MCREVALEVTVRLFRRVIIIRKEAYQSDTEDKSKRIALSYDKSFNVNSSIAFSVLFR